MHIPKTAGTSFQVALREALKPAVAVGGFDRVLFGDFADFATLAEAIRRQVYLSADGLPAADLIAGHFAYSTLRQRYGNAQFLTVLREPCSRLLSHWLFWRSHCDEQLAAWGSWAERVRLSRLPLATFLDSRRLACQVDNLALRMLLWPHPLIPADGFINPRYDRRLLAQARERLRIFDIVDVMENPGLTVRLRNWTGRPFVLERMNEASRVPEPLRSELATELATRTIELLAIRSRLDLQLWSDAARRCLPGRDPAQVREQTWRCNVARFGALLA